MKKPKLKVELRDNTGKGINKKLRKEGIVPGVLYSPHDKENLVLKVNNAELSKLLSEEGTKNLPVYLIRECIY